MINFLLVFITFFFLIGCSSGNGSQPQEKEGVFVYYQTDFDKGKGGFQPAKRAKLRLTEDAISGKALETICKQKWAGPALKIKVRGSKGLKIAFLAKGEGFKRATLNLYDTKARDNTTPYGYRFLPDGEWTPVLYYVDLFHYNSRPRGYIKPDTLFVDLRFWGPDPKGGEVSLTLDNFVIYRGEDRAPPKKIKMLKAEATPQGIKLTWETPEDNVFPMVYVVSRAKEGKGFVKIGETYRSYFWDYTAGKKNYRYRVLACDFQNNLGPWSDIISVKGEADPRPPSLTREEQDRLSYASHVREIHRRGEGRVKKGLVVLFGDSLTGPTLYPRLVAGALGIYQVKAYGFAGQTTTFGRRKVAEILAKERPEFLFVMFGTNNVRGRLQTVDVYERWIDDLEAIVKQAEAQGVVVALATIPPRGFKDPLSLPEALFNEILVQRARRLKVPIAYIFEAVQQAGDRREFIWKDGVHWTPQGMELAAWAWRKTMRQIEFALRDRP
ncbi:SGNH/GDSL hydrolase family protein [Thermosulfuriphilus ammonigenes]|uniref:SGNH/GDSL hydrolase family protein n=1 Tax=Thermosulfuriphilus ammonigenes TaxID=1936021 RepID=A0A6G7PY35_9BACT|nr:SGNH/GDSL hydrolase family protein [Thermosulfuriphilus ammonigenes]MBA2849850.1 lysophospholipase L1-like esterase [Thermosulfuriphilus ammonigenes]QIJ72605.1 SGNH/GDSL hydrolase family protein [Thermosulfuriphilus ammonigenes]